MNRQPSQRVDALIHTITHEPLSQDDIVAHLKIMRDNFEKEQAEAYRSIKCLIKYVGVKESI